MKARVPSIVALDANCAGRIRSVQLPGASVVGAVQTSDPDPFAPVATPLLTATTLVPCTKVVVTGVEAPPENDHEVVAAWPRATEDAPEAVSAGRARDQLPLLDRRPDGEELHHDEHQQQDVEQLEHRRLRQVTGQRPRRPPGQHQQGQRGQDEEQRDAGVDDVPRDLEHTGPDAAEPRRRDALLGIVPSLGHPRILVRRTRVTTVRGRCVTRTGP